MNAFFQVMHDAVIIISIRTFTTIVLLVFIVVVPILFFVDLALLLIITTRFTACLAWLIVIGITGRRMNRTWTKIVTARSTTRCWWLRRCSRESCSAAGHTTRRRIRMRSSLLIAIGQLRQAIANSWIAIVQLRSDIGKKLRGWWRGWSTASVLVITMKISTSHGRNIIGRWTRDRRIPSAKRRVSWLAQWAVSYLLPLGISVTSRLAATSKHKDTWTGFFFRRRTYSLGDFVFSSTSLILRFAAADAIRRVVTVSVRTSVSMNIGRRVIDDAVTDELDDAALFVSGTSIISSSIMLSAIVLLSSCSVKEIWRKNH